MRTLGAAAPIPAAYRHVRTPIVRLRTLYRDDFEAQERYRRLITFLNYLRKAGKSGTDAPTELFGPGADDLEAFLAAAWAAPHTFQVIVSPDSDAAQRLPLQEYAEVLMTQVQADLGIPLLWVGAVHRDADPWHFQALLLGQDTYGHPFRIARQYIEQGWRARAAEVQAWY